MKERTLCGRTALVTGATGLIGRAIALSLAAEGASVVVHYRHAHGEAESLCREIRRHGVGAWLLRADFKNRAACESLIKRAVNIAGKLDVLVNSASSFTKSALVKGSLNDLADAMRVNAWAPLMVSRAFGRSAEKGAIVNLLDSRIMGGDRSHAGYIVSKHALTALTAMMAMEFAPRIAVNAVAPGLIMARPGECTRAKNLPLRRCGTPGDVAQAVVFLVKSRFITGHIIWVDGGRHLRESLR
jgi:pteridine reductase